jgi:hypothetical protein
MNSAFGLFREDTSINITFFNIYVLKTCIILKFLPFGVGYEYELVLAVSTQDLDHVSEEDLTVFASATSSTCTFSLVVFVCGSV